MDAAGALLTRQRVASPSDSYKAIVSALTTMVMELQNDTAADATTPVGIGTPGVWVAAQQAMKNCNSTVLNGRPLLVDLEAALGKRVRLANDANCFALSEAMDGAAAGAASVFGVILGTGVGGGLVINGQLISGATAIAGEWGHTPVAYLRHAPRTPRKDPRAIEIETDSAANRAPRFHELQARLTDRECYCGRVNCVETFLSGPGLARTAQELLGAPSTAEEVFAANSSVVSEADDLETVRELYCDLLARSLAQVMNVVDPQVVVLGGGLSAQPLLYERLRVWVPNYLFNSEGAAQTPEECGLQILPPMHGDSSGVRGAAWLWPAANR